MEFIVFIILIIAFCALKFYATQKSRDRIYQKYGHTQAAERIIKKTIWVGETTEQLVDSLGKPRDTDENVLKTKRKEVWKYYQRGVNRYGLRIKIENDTVIGWDEKL